MPKSTICLSMIVKNEAHILARCLRSVLPHIDVWIVCDTGSTDTTQDVVEDLLGEVPGIFYKHAWVDFAHNRNLALDAARRMQADYILTIDADEWLEVRDPHCFDDLDAAGYMINYPHEGTSFGRVGLVRSDRPWTWRGVIHETLQLASDDPILFLPGVVYATSQDGARSRDPDKAVAEIALIEDLLVKEPENPRLWYFLAGAYTIVGNSARAIAAYERRLDFDTGNGDEIWHSAYKLGWLYMLTDDWEQARRHYQDATLLMPDRAEAFFWWAMGHLRREEYADALPLFAIASRLAKPVIGHLVEQAIYDYAALTNYAVCAALAGRQAAALAVAGQALRLPDLPEAQRTGLNQLINDLSGHTSLD